MDTQEKGTSLIGKCYDALCKGELYVSAALFLLIVGLVFISAITRKMGVPIQWTMDVTKLCFAWLAFFSGDIALRKGALPGMDMLFKKFPKKVQVVLKYVIWILMIGLLVFFIYFGFKLALSNSKRTFQTLQISYSIVSLSLPVCSIFMVLSIISSIIKDYSFNKTGK